jgi:hypothetical protein
VIPFSSSYQFLPESNQSGLQSLCNSVRQHTREVSNHHAALSKSLEGSVIEPLKKLRHDIKAHIKL